MRYIEEIDDVFHPMDDEMPPRTTRVDLMRKDGSVVSGEIVAEPSGYYVYDTSSNGWGSLTDYSHWRFAKRCEG